MHYVAAGQGDAVLLLHGWPGFWFDYQRVLSPAALLGRVVAPDFLGFGRSSAVRGDPAQVADEEQFAQDMLDLANLRLDQVLLVGHDIGSAVAPALARLAPDRVRGPVLLNPTHPFIGDKTYSPAAQHEAWYERFHRLALAERLIDGDLRRVALYLAHFYERWAGDNRIVPGEFDVVVREHARSGAFASSLAWYRASGTPRSARRARPDRRPDDCSMGRSRPDAASR
jgi:pimeloyl-ACP methyl ester carboxylesterase